MRWLVSLVGNSTTLCNLSQFMSSSHFRVFDISDDHEAENYFLRSSHFDGDKTESEVCSSALGLIQLINGAYAINLGFKTYESRGSVIVEKLLYTKLKCPGDADWMVVRVDNSIPPSNPFIGRGDDSVDVNPYGHDVTAFIELSLKYEDVFNIVRQVAMGVDWRNLYCIWDTVSHYCGGSKVAIKELGLDESVISAFTGTANSFEALGLEARHGVKGWSVPKNIVSHEKAVDIVNEVVTKYMSKKYGKPLVEQVEI